MRARADLVELARAFASIVERIAERDAPTEQDGWLDQHSPEAALGVRWHCRAVRRRRAEGKPGAAIEGRRYLLTREAMNEEILRSPKPGLRKCPPIASGPRETTTPPSRRDTVAEATAARLRLIRQRGK
jgi:hypothetical protein